MCTSQKGFSTQKCRERVLLRIIENLRLSDLIYQLVHSFDTRRSLGRQLGSHRPNICEKRYRCSLRKPPGGSSLGRSWLPSVSVSSSLSLTLCALLWCPLCWHRKAFGTPARFAVDRPPFLIDLDVNPASSTCAAVNILA